MREIKDGKIYVYTNIAKLEQDGIRKQYIGQTIRTTKERSGKDGIRYTRDKTTHDKFANAIKKWGWDAFECKVLIDGIDDYNELLKLERLFIAMFDTYENGYNSTKGGEGTLGSSHNKGREFSEEQRQKLSEAKKGKDNHQRGRARTNKQKEQFKELRATQIGEGHPNWGKGNSIYCVELDVTFGGYAEASRYIVAHGGTKTFDGRNLNKAINNSNKTYKYIIIDGEKINLHWQTTK